MGDFWIRYDKLADKFDKDMLAGLNTNLDVLLIFAGLFSAVNTAFIVVVLAALSANPLDQTNLLLQLLVMNASNGTLTRNDLTRVYVPGKGAVRQNCTFFASLSCSLLAAAGGVLAKQWLQEYSRTGQTGSIEEQSRKRAEKFQGAERWGLRFVVEALQALLLISLALFFIGLVDYLWMIDRCVALVVFAFAVVSLVFYGFTVVVSVVYTTSPFQTPVSAVIRKVQQPLRDIFYSPDFLGTRGVRYTFWDPAIASLQLGAARVNTAIRAMHIDLTSSIEAKNFPFDLFKAALWILWTIISPIVIIIPCLFIWPVQPSDVGELDVFLALWMTETAPDHKHLLTVAQNIPLVTDINAVQLISRSSVFSLLLSRFTETFLEVQRNPTEDNVAHASTMARAVACVLFADPERSWLKVRRACVSAFNCEPGDTWRVGDSAQDFINLFGSIFGLCDPWPGKNTIPRISALGNFPFQSTQKTFDATVYLRYCIVSGMDVFVQSDDKVYNRLSSALLLDEGNVDQVYLSCASRTL
ncbi:hypothetical protein FRB95_003232 [Tulasnella sp. JGI-2019a]|nr:hypothetical protein FRB95_003232 [Tulasnella sp. JGI-2019a]